MRDDLRSRGLLLVFLTATISGVATFVNFWAVQGTNSDGFIAARNGLVAIALVPFALLAARGLRTRLRGVDWARLAAIGFVGGAVPFILFFRGLQLAGSGGAGTASFAYRTLFLIAAVLAVAFLRERASWRVLAAAGLILAGNALLLSLWEPVWTDGTALVLAATVLWAGEYTLSKRALRDLPSGIVALGRMGFGAVFLFVYLGATGQLGAIGALTAPQLEWMIVSAVLLVGFVSTWYTGLKYTDLSVATAVLILGFPITLALSAATGRVAVDLADVVGVVAIVLGAGIAVGAVALRTTWTYAFQDLPTLLRSPK